MAAKRIENSIKQVPELEWVERISRLMDSQFSIPGTNYRFGLDPLIGLVPLLGDISSFAISGSLILTMARHGASRKLVILMLGNLALDTFLGSIPLIGNIFDFAYKANQRNLNLLKKHYTEGKYQGSGTGIVIGAFLVMVAIFSLVVYGSWKLVSYLVELF